MAKMRLEVLALLLILFFSVREIMADGYDEGEGEGEGEGEREREGELFLLRNSKQVVKTDAGEVRVVKGGGFMSSSRKGMISIPSMHIGFITIEPNALFIPQYLDASLIIFVRRGEMKIGWIYKDKMVEKNLRIGDVYRIPAGFAFYIVNTGKGQRLQLICSIDTSESLGAGVFQSFYIGGGTSVLAGFDRRTLATALNITGEDLTTILRGRTDGPIVYMNGSHQPSKWTASMQQQYKHSKTEKHSSWDGEDGDDNEEKSQQQPQQEQQPIKWTWRKLLNSILGKAEDEEKEKQNAGGAVHAPDSYNIYDRNHDFQNDYGWSLAVDGHQYTPLWRSNTGVYLVNLTAGSMMAPHVNPMATEYGIVLKGTGTIQVVFPNGTLAMNAEVAEGDVFWVPRYFPFCQIASRSGAMEFFGFTTSARTNRPQFFAGASSVLKTMMGKEMAAAFGLSEERLKKIIDAQTQSVILPAFPTEGKKGGGSSVVSEMLVDLI